jgi:anti-anti-sigma factor
MSSFSTRVVSDAVVVEFDSSAGLNHFQNNTVRDALYELVSNSAEPRLGIDLCNVDFLSSSGVALLVGLKRRVEGRGGKLVLFRLQSIVRDILAVTKLDQFFIIVETEAQALASLRPDSVA